MSRELTNQHLLRQRVTRGINPFVLRVAHLLPFYCVIEHCGRKSGRSYRTPLAVIPVKGGFLLPLAWGHEPQWFQNLVHAGGATLEWRGVPYAIEQPVPTSWEEASASLNAVQRTFAPVFGVKSFVRVAATP
jgi:deazaflavin-dependent oxidoreductase (nitroreductase family)